MAGLPATFGFVAKEVITTAKKLSDPFWIVGSATLFVSALGVAVAAVATLRIFFGRPTGDAANAHDEGLRLALPPLFLAAMGIVFGLMPDLAANLVVDAARVIAPSLQYADANLDTEWGTRFGSTATVLALGACVYATWDRLHAALEHLHPLQSFSPSRAYDWGLVSLKKGSMLATTRLSNGRLGTYLFFAALGTVLLVSPWLLIPTLTGTWPADISSPALSGSTADIPVLFGCAIVVAGAALALVGRDTLQQLLGSGGIGVGSAFIFLFRGAPDLALTQLAVETVFVIVAAVAIRRYRPLATRERLHPLGALTSGAFGVLVGSLLFAVMLRPYHGELADYFLSTSVPGAHGRNVVNVIIVDFRGLDTLGEITVVLLAALAARALVARHRATRARA
jgi:multicomponent Na+:H+ antiporter subunit A